MTIINLSNRNLSKTNLSEHLNEASRGVKTVDLTNSDNFPNDLIQTLLERGCENFIMNSCDIKGVQVPKSFIGVKIIHMADAKNIPAGLIEKAIEDGVEYFDLKGCDLKNVKMPLHFKQNLDLNLWCVDNMPDKFIESATNAGVFAKGMLK